MKKILYIHGFASTGQTSKVDQLKAMTGVEVIAPNLSHDPVKDITILEDIVRTQNITMVVGSSLGGFYALYLAQRFDLGLVLINPSLKPYETLKDKLGEVSIFGSNASFSWTAEKLDQLKDLDKVVSRALGENSSIDWAKTLVLLATKDERLDSGVTRSAFSKAKVVEDSMQDHRFAGISMYDDEIKSILYSLSPSDSSPELI